MCRQCATHLTCDYTERPKSIDNCWTGFIWSILRNEDVQAKYEGDSICKFIPSKWRPWWIVEIKNDFPDTFGRSSLESPSSISVDITKDIQEWGYYINSYKLF